MITYIAGGLGICVAILILWLVRKDRLHVSHGFGWIVVAGCFALLGLAPGIIDWLAQRVGVAYPPVLALTIAIVVLVVKILLMDIERSRLDMRSQRLTQRIAMLEAELKRTEHSRMSSTSE